MNHRYFPSRRAGMTLVELMIVIVCMAIAALLVLPNLGQAAPQQLVSAAQMVAADLQYARVRSLYASTDPIVVVFDVDAETYYLALSSDTSTPITNPADNTPYLLTFGQGRAIAMNSVTLGAIDVGGTSELAYGALGSLSSGTDATITLAADSMTLVLTVDGDTGAVSIGDIQ